MSTITIPERWKTDGVLPPTIECKMKAAKVILLFYKIYKLIPVRTSASIEEGIFITYKNYLTGKDLSIEIYNDLDNAAIITHNKSILKSSNIIDENFDEIIHIFQAK